MSFYLDGTLLSHQTSEETNGAGSKNLDTTFNLQIGNKFYCGRTFDGLIDEVRVYNRALGASEIQELYRTGARTVKFKQ